MPIPDTIYQLVKRFQENSIAYRSTAYNETQLRREFVDPFFEALGWDVSNRQGYAEAYKDVIHEDAIKVGGATRAPDYAFRIGGMRKFFIEAKKPSVNLKEDVSPAFQLRRYAWSAKLALSILTDFEEFAAYDCRLRPDKSDKASTGRIMYLHYRDYPDHWDEIASRFSREAVLKGAFDQYAEESTGKHGAAEVDDAFLAEISRWRDLLAHNIALRNPNLSQRDLNYAVQMTIDRIIFLRISEDRGIETYGRLQNLLKSKTIYPLLCDLFAQADHRYNSGLFHFHDEKGRAGLADRLTLGLSIDDKVLKDILSNLYYPDSPYEFSVLPADILGQVYEQFLGKVIRLTKEHRAVVEDKPEVKKAGGVFYTPTYIVDYIVKQTVGELLKDKTPKTASEIKILDPACGSGSFLLGAYQYLLDWHLACYTAKEPEKLAAGHNPPIFQSAAGWQLTTAEKKRILLNNIYGVDIDPQAVEVTKLSLLLKVLEGENEQTLGKQLTLFGERALPDLAQNIKCGNSLIGPDFYTGRQLGLGLDNDETYRINAFDWQKEFQNIFANGGFDVVIGNPPYVRQEGLGKDKAYFQYHYKTFVPTADLYVNFIEKATQLCVKTGRIGMIVSNKWLRAAYGQPLREYLKSNATLFQVVDLAGLPVFKNATVRTIIVISSPKVSSKSSFHYLAPPSMEEFSMIRSGDDLKSLFERKTIDLSISSLSADGWSFANDRIQHILEQIKNGAIPITRYIESKLYRGVITGFNKAFVIDQQTRDKFIAANSASTEILKPLVGGRDVRRYSIDYNDKYLIWTYIGVPISRYPEIFEHLKQHQSELQKRWDKGNYWWELRACDYYNKFFGPKIIYPDIATNCRFYLDVDGYFGTNTTYFAPSSDYYLLGILNSSVAQFYFKQICAGLEGGETVYLRFFGQYIENFPVRTTNPNNPVDITRHDQIVELVQNMLATQKRLASVRTPSEKTILQRQVETIDHNIDELVYELYGLTDEEISIIEG